MGSTDKRIDFKVGGLVWVRRRNGSWWPGTILSPDELPDGCAAIPRSGTPVKLLGKNGTTVLVQPREVKRVKAFHCGEYEDCIEKAKVSASHFSRKGVRKARREDAIRHALELESALLLKDNPEASDAPNLGNGRGCGQVHDPTSGLHHSEVIENQDLRKSEHSDINNRGIKIDSSFEEQEIPRDEPVKWKTPHDSEEDVVGVKRMRELEDLGVGVSSSVKRKRSQVAYESLKKRNRPLTKVLECSTMLSSPLEQFHCPNGLSDGVAGDHRVSGFESHESINSISIEITNEADCMEFLCSNSTLKDTSLQPHEWKDNYLSFVQDDNESCENLFDVPLLSEGMPAVVSDASQRVQFGDKTHSSQSGFVETPPLATEEKIESCSHQNNLALEKPTSDWQTKGKRNSRARKLDTDDENLCSLNQREPTTENPSEVVASQKLLSHCLSSVSLKHVSADFSLRRHFSDSCLCDITVEVKSSDEQHVPCISLMSKVNNLPITGHPLKTEVLEDGSCSGLLINYMHEDMSTDDQQGMGLPLKPHFSKSSTSRSKSSKSKKIGMPSKKTRKLSSLTGTRGFNPRKPVSPVACIPLKVVFSRISASLSTPSHPVPHVVETSGIELPP